MLLDNYPNNHIKNNGKPHLYFGGTDYLSMQVNGRFIDFIHKNLKLWGTCFGNSRDNNIQLSIYDKFEHYFANFLKTEASLSISSGTLAGFLIKDYFSKKNVKAFHLSNSHPAIVLPHSVTVFNNGKLHPNLLSNTNETVLICVDAILGLATKPTDFSFLNAINPNKKVILLIDESHSLGVLGKNGCGISSTINHPIIEQKIILSSLSKAYGVSGGIIASDLNFINEIKKLALFSGASGMNPAILQSIMDAKTLYQEQLDKLKRNLEYIYTKLPKLKEWNFTADYPVIYYPKELKVHFLNNNIVTTNFIYQNKEINRIVIKANHTQDDLDNLLKLMP